MHNPTKQFPHLYPSQQDIITMLFDYRFLTRIHIQQLLHHKNPRAANRWLKYLHEHHFVERLPISGFTDYSKPLVYYLGPSGIRWLRTKKYPEHELRKRYYDASRSASFVEKSLLIADCCCALANAESNDMYYDWSTEAKQSPHTYGYDYLKPSLDYEKHTDNASKRYFVEVFAASQPRQSVRHRIKQYIAELESASIEDDSEPLPTIHFICPGKTDVLYAKRALKTSLMDCWLASEVHFYITTFDCIRTQGFRAKVWTHIVCTPNDTLDI